MHYIQQFLVVGCTEPDNKSKEQQVELFNQDGEIYTATRRCWGGWPRLKRDDIVGIDTEIDVPNGIHLTHWEACGFVGVVQSRNHSSENMKQAIKVRCDAINRCMRL